MKKVKYLVLVIIATIICFSLSGCGIQIEDEVRKNISDVRYNLFDAKTSKLKTNIMCGMRENPYTYNGYSEEKCEFGVITVMLYETIPNETINFTLNTTNQTYTGQLERNPRNGSFMTDIQTILADDENLILSLEGIENDIQLICQSKNWTVQYEDAFLIGMETLKDEINNFFTKKKFNAEVYIKIIYDEKAILDNYFWYFGILGTDGTNVCVIIDTNGKILNSWNK